MTIRRHVNRLCAESSASSLLTTSCAAASMAATKRHSLPFAAAAHGDGPGERMNQDLWPSLSQCSAFMLHPYIVSAWHQLPNTVVNGSAAGPSFYSIFQKDPAFRHIFDSTMVSLSSAYIHSFCTRKFYDMDPEGQARTFVDVGGASGHFAAAISRSFPHLRRVVNFDLPPVIAAAPNFSGVEHVQGDMFQCVPSADIVFMKSVLHNWCDDDCIRILQNCRESLIGCKKLVILDVVHENTIMDVTHASAARTRLAMDTAMLAFMNTRRGNERTKIEWEIILKEAKFENIKFFELEESLKLFSIIEATIH